MRKILLLAALCATFSVDLFADKVQVSTTPPGSGSPEHVYQMQNGNGLICSSTAVPTKNSENYGAFAFYESPKGGDAYYIYSYKAKKWLTYTRSTSYSPQTNFIKLSDEQDPDCYFKVNNYSDEKYEIQPYTTSGTTSNYLNWYQGIGSNPYDGTVTLGIWSQDGASDAGSSWTFTEVTVKTYVYTITAPAGTVITYEGKTYAPGDQITTEGPLNRKKLTVSAQDGKFAVVSVNDAKQTITISYVTTPTQPETSTYTKAVLYPAQQTEVGDATLTEKDNTTDTVYTFKNNVLAASFVKTAGALVFAGSKAMNLEAGTEPFTIAFGTGTNVPASGMTLKSVAIQDIKGDANAVGGAEHYDGKALVANYEYAYEDSVINVEWKAVLRNGSHYLRTEMQLTGMNAIDMYNVIPMIYNVNAKDAGSTPAVVGNTRGAVVISDKIFAGLENPVGYNTVGDATGDEDNWVLSTTADAVTLQPTAWTQVEEANVPNRFTEVTGNDYPHVYQHTESVGTLKKDQKVEVTVTYKNGSHRLNFGGAELLQNGTASVADDFHSGFSGIEKSNNTFSMVVPNDGTFSLRVYVDDIESINATSEWQVKVYDVKPGTVINSNIVPVEGRWSRNTTLKKGDTWKISAVVGLVAQDGKKDNTTILQTQKRRSFLAYSERERAVPWRAFPVYISWYELNINRNDAADPTQNMNAEQVLDVERHWLNNFYNRYKIGPKAFVIDDGWDNYGLWTFHKGFPNEMRDIADSAKTMNAGVGAWLGPVGGYGKSGDYRRAYWNSNNRGGMQLSNPAYYKVFLDAARNLTQNNGDFRFFKFDGISAQFSAVGPDEGDTGNENAEGIIRLEQFVRDSLRRDIFFNTTVGTWASPFWYHITDATWRQEKDYGTLGNNSIDRENWITYRDHLVYQNYVSRSPICPINTLMTHGFILSKFGSVSSNINYEAVRRELRAAFVCGSGMVELYNDYSLMNNINNGALWADLAECIKWQQRNADVLPDAHWVGGDPWDGSKANVYGWASWNGKKATLALRNGANDSQTYTFTLREALNIPANVQSATITLRKSFGDQDALTGLTEGKAISIDETLTVTLPGSSLYAFDGVQTDEVKVAGVEINSENGSHEIAVNENLALDATVTPSNASFQALEWTSSDESVAKVVNGLVLPAKVGKVVITAKAIDGSNAVDTFEVNIVDKAFEPYACNFDKDDAGSAHNRYITTITFTPSGQPAQSLAVGTSHKPYVDKVDSVLTCHAGDSIKVNFNIVGAWMNAYVYIDVNQDSVFQFRPDTLDQSGTDVMTYSFYTGSFSDDTNGQNSAGESITGNNRNTMDCPVFQAPTKAGTYRIRFKMDWNSVDPGGQVGTDGTLTQHNAFFDTSGEIVDATLEVADVPTGITETQSAAKGDGAIYDLQGRKLNKEPKRGIFIRNGKKIVK